jgi:hypothetical protein
LGNAGWSPVGGPISTGDRMAKQSKNTRGMKAAKPARHRQGDGCDTGRRRYARKGDVGAPAEQCGRCKGWHAVDDRPKGRRR